MNINIPELSEIINRVNLLEESIASIKQQSPSTKKEWYSLREASERLNCSTKTVSRLIERGDLCKHLGLRHIRIPESSIEEYEKKFLNRK